MSKPQSSDEDLLELFASRPAEAWSTFLDRYAAIMLAYLRGLGFDHDEAMDRFVYVCEKLCEADFRRLRGIRRVGDRGELTPWLRTVIKNLCVSWFWAQKGRNRLLRSIEQLPPRDQRVFELYYWHGMAPSQILEQLRREATDEPIELVDVIDSIERVVAELSATKRWRLLSNLSRARGSLTFTDLGDRDGIPFEPVGAGLDPEQALLTKEHDDRLHGALARLDARDRMILQLRYEELMTVAAIAELIELTVSQVKRSLKDAVGELRAHLREGSVC